MKKTVHIVSHSHWDREWYLPLENHKMRLVNLLDGVIEASKDDRFVSFQMDGQFLPIEDYLAVKAENRKKIYELIKEGKIIVGPWFILQDTFLTSGESNVRNLQMGIKRSNAIGKACMIGYFPDTFGNIGQAAQILKKAGINNSFFGRGAKATGFNNAVIEDYTFKNSELYWEASDGTKVLAILFANWYCNGVDMPSTKEELKPYLDKKIKDMEKYAATSQLLLMNGCDHSPVQKNIGQIIELANSLYDDYEFVHSNLEDYAKRVYKEVKEKNIKLETVKGELRSQNTDGWGSLTSTSSSRYDLKRYNKMIEMRIEEVIQPLYSLFFDKKLYPFSKIDYLYRKLFTNHPHDSICGCSIDSVHEGNKKRFKDVSDILDYLEGEAKIYLSKNIKKEYPNKVEFSIINTCPFSIKKEASVVVDYEKIQYSGFEYPEYIKKLEKLDLSNIKVKYKDKLIDAEIEDLGVNFGYDLLEDAFRKRYFSRKLRINFLVELKGFEVKNFYLEKDDSPSKLKEYKKRKIETDVFEIEILDNAGLNILDKRNNRKYENVLTLEDSGDIGNEYIYCQSFDKKVIRSNNLVDYSIKECGDKYEINILEKISLPEKSQDSLLEEQKKLVDIKDRKSERSNEFKDLFVKKKITFKKTDSDMKVKMSLKNNIKDHRLRVFFGHDIKADSLVVESIFENVRRKIKKSPNWTNPDYSQNLNRYVQIYDDLGGITVSSIGCQEYENLDDGLYITLFRSVGEMGDWGYFPTKDSQMLTDMDFDFNVDFFVDDNIQSQKKVLALRIPYFTCQVDENDGKIGQGQRFNLDLRNNFFSTLYRNKENEAILRVYNPNGSREEIGQIKGEIYDILANKRLDNGDDIDSLSPYEIRTIKLEEK